jgi:hypothetical protein
MSLLQLGSIQAGRVASAGYALRHFCSPAGPLLILLATLLLVLDAKRGVNIIQIGHFIWHRA